MFAIPGDTPEETIAAIIADELAIGSSTTNDGRARDPRAREMPATWCRSAACWATRLSCGEPFSARDFLRRGGALPATVTSLRN